MSKFNKILTQWYNKNARKLPWRTIKKNPYHTWISEIMLQQTTTKTVSDYFGRFIKKYPTINKLNQAKEEDIMKIWAGLGYYSRAKNIKKTAKIIVSEYDSKMPDTVKELKKLPGIGDYTAAAIVTIAFNKTAAPVDGNIKRVVSRVTMNKKNEAEKFMQKHITENNPGDFVQAMMDLGATICSPKNPKCLICPVEKMCKAKKYNKQNQYPVKDIKKIKPIRHGAAFVIVRKDRAILLTKREDKGLLAGMSTLPTTKWSAKQDGQVGAESAPFKSKWEYCGEIKHTFTHFHLQLEVWKTKRNNKENIKNAWWVKSNKLNNEALPTLMKKAIKITGD